jgi:hypothetical protein
LVVAGLLLLLVIGGFASGVGTGLAMLGLVALIAGGWAVVRGHASWLHLATRRAGLVVGVAGLAAFVVGAAVSPSPTRTSGASASDALASSSPLPSPSEAPLSSVAPLVDTAPVTTSAPVTSSAPALPPAPTMSLTCPAGGFDASPEFAEHISATAPYTVDIAYGDGDRYRNDDKHLAAIFSHRYSLSGNFTVNAVLTDAAGQTTSASCLYSWTKPAPSHTSTGSTRSSVGSPSGGTSTGSGPSSVGGSSSGGDTYTNVDGNQVHVPVQAPSAPAGATAHCRDGSWSFSQHHSGTCSHHGGVAEWL